MAEEIEDIVGIDATDAVRCSAKTGVGVTDVLERFGARYPAAARRPGRLRCGHQLLTLVSITTQAWYRWVRIKNGTMRKATN